ncbi:MAG TPA: HEAT repeat domain-containing protein [Planctomycetota bacterium]|nr:HEAT repeat domain-containing protein [Planctomycetota bacterium]
MNRIASFQFSSFSCIILLLSAAVFCGENAPPDKTAEPATSEQIVRERFLLAYQTAKNSDRKAETADMLQGLKERESHRLLTGMLADRDEKVRLRACKAISGTPDSDGYFVKPLMGALADNSATVRIAAADALGSAQIKADAIKALTFSMMSSVGQLETKNSTAVIEAYDKALERLAGQRSPLRDARALSNFWMDYWKKNEESLRQADSARLPGSEPVRPEGLPRDSFDKK